MKYLKIIFKYYFLVVIVTLYCLNLNSGKAQSAQELYQLAGEAAQSGEYSSSATYFLQIVDLEGPSADLYYYAACSFAMAKETSDAFLYLDKALELGFARIKLMESDTDLLSLHEDKRWSKMLALCRINSRVHQQMYETPALETPFQENLSEEEKIAGLSKFWMQTKFSFANFDLVPKLNWDSLYLAYLPKVQQTQTSLEYYYQLAEMCAKLKDSHTNILPPQELMDSVYGNVPLTTKLIEGKVLVEEVKDTTLAIHGLRKGQEVISVNGLPVKEYAAQYVIPYQSASTLQNMEVLAYHHYFLAGQAGQNVMIVVKDSKGKEQEFSLKRIPLNDYWKLPKARPAFEFRMLEGNVAYIALNNFFDNTAVNEFIKHLDSIRKADAIVLDVRENPGGNGSVGYSILEHFITKPVLSSVWESPKFIPVYKAWGRTLSPYTEEGTILMPVEQALTQAVVMLVSAKTFSASEDFAVAFRAAERGLIVGEPTGGSTGQPLIFSLPGGFRARVCAKKELYPDGQPFVGIGIQPDIVVKTTVEAFRDGKDEVLEAALLSLESNKAN